MDTQRPIFLLPRVLVAIAGFVPVLMATGPAVAAGAVSAPQLSIDVGNGRTSTKAGETLEYTVTVRNLGTEDVAGLHVTQSVPPGLRFDAADAAGAVDAGKVYWHVDLTPNGAATFHTTMTVLETPPELLRLATVACASTSADGPPVVCASHSDQLPTGAAAQAAATTESAVARSGVEWWYFAGGAVLLAVVAATVLILRRRRARRTG